MFDIIIIPINPFSDPSCPVLSVWILIPGLNGRPSIGQLAKTVAVFHLAKTEGKLDRKIMLIV